MAVVSHVFTLAYVAELFGEDEDWIHEISIDMEPEDGLIGIHGPNDQYTTAFTDFGIENLRQLVEIHRQDAAQDAKLSAKKPKQGS